MFTTMSGYIFTSIITSSRFAGRELQHAIGKFYIFISCLAISTMMIAGIGAVTQSLNNGILARSQQILGGDIALKRPQLAIKTNELAILANFGKVSENIVVTAMARSAKASATARSSLSLVQLKAVDNAYPLYGRLRIKLGDKIRDDLPIGEALAKASADAPFPAFVDDRFLLRLGLQAGDKFTINKYPFIIRGLIVSEPDLLDDGISLAPKIIIAVAALKDIGLMRPGNLARYSYRLRLPGVADKQAVTAVSERLLAKLPSQGGWRLQTREQAASGLKNTIGWFSDFLIILSLSSLIAGGIGIANAVRNYIEGARKTIAIYKSLGASSKIINMIVAMQIAALAAIGIGLGLLLSILFPVIISFVLPDSIPFSSQLIYPQQWLIAVVSSLSITLIFSLRPILASGNIKASELFRIGYYEHQTSKFTWAVIIFAFALLLGFITVISDQPMFTMRYIAIMLLSFITIWLFARGCRYLAAILPPPRNFLLRMTIANINRKGSPSMTIMLSIGLGLTIMLALALIENNINKRLAGDENIDIPSFFFIDIRPRQLNEFKTIFTDNAPGSELNTAPLLRGRIIKIRDIKAGDYDAPADAQWVLRSDRGITFAAELPANSRLKAGKWWPKDYQGEPLVSFEADLADELNIKIGDKLTINIMGRNIVAKVANLRTLKWESLSINFVMVVSPNTVAGFPYDYLASVTWSDDSKPSADSELALVERINDKLPGVTVIRLREALQAARDLISKMSWGIRVAALITLLVAVMVLASAIASSHNYNKYRSGVLKTLGADKYYLLKIYLVEYAVLGLLAAVFALVAGSAGAWAIVGLIMDIDFTFFPYTALFTVLFGVVLVLLFGFIDNWRLLKVKPAKILRDMA